MEKIRKILYGIFMWMVFCGCITFMYTTNRAGNALKKMYERYHAIVAQHEKELVDTADVLKTYVNNEGIKIIVDNYTEVLDTITMDIIVDTTNFRNVSTFDVFRDDDSEILPSATDTERDFAQLGIDALKVETDMSDEMFRDNFVSESYLTNYPISPHFENLSWSTETSSDYGFVMNVEPVTRKQGQKSGIKYNGQTRFTVVCNKNTVRLLRVYINHRAVTGYSTCVYMLINTEY